MNYYLASTILADAEAGNRFEERDTSLLEIWLYQNGAHKTSQTTLICTAEDGEKRYRFPKTIVPECAPPELDGMHPIGGLRLLAQQSRIEQNVGVVDKIPWKDEATFWTVYKAMKLPPTYIPLLNSWTGVVQASMTPRSESSYPSLDFVAQNTNYNSDSWSLALSFDPESGITSGIFSASARTNPQLILDHLKKSKRLALHPMLLPVILFRTLLESNFQHCSKLHKDICKIEFEIGHVPFKSHNLPCEAGTHAKGNSCGCFRSPSSFPTCYAKEPFRRTSGSVQGDIEDRAVDEDKLNQTPEYFQRMSLRLNTCMKQQASRDGRHQIWRQFRKALDDAFDVMPRISSPRPEAALGDAQRELNRWTVFDAALFESLEARDVNYRERIKTQLSVLYSMITQRDSRDQASIAKAAKQDSADMKFFALLGSCFLPANYVATLFTIDKFQFIKNSWVLFAVYCVISVTLISICVILYRFRRRFWGELLKRKRRRAAILDGVPVEWDTDISVEGASNHEMKALQLPLPVSFREKHFC